LKSIQVEFKHITDEFHRVALAHPNIQFHFYNNGSELFHLPKAGYRQRIVAVFGNKTNEKLVPVEEETQVVKISGFISKPEFSKKSRGEQFFFVNDRFIKSPYLHHAVVSAFEGLIRSDNYPGYFLYLTINPASIDINIHPTKTEIKFEDENTLYAILRSAIKHALGQFNVIPALDFEQDQNLETPYAYQNKGADMPKVVVDVDFNPFSNEIPRSKIAPYFEKQTTIGWQNLYVGLESKVGKEADFSSVSFESESISGGIFDNDKTQVENVSTTFQLKRKYIVTTIKSGMIIIDQSRAHQRVLYENFLKNITIKQAVSQQLLFPLSLSFSKSDVLIIKEIKDNLTTLGFAFDAVDDEHIAISGLPLLLPESEVGMVLDQLISDFQMDVPGDSFSQSDIVSKTLSKTLAVKTGEQLDSESQLALVNNLFACKEYKISPFNKPIYITITGDDIDKKFY
jgi:DNA mismatch repair protein MutL